MDPIELQRGTQAFVAQLTALQDENPDISDLHEAFERWCMERYSIGESSNAIHTGARGDLGVDFYSASEGKYLIGQCKVPRQDALESDPLKIRKFGTSAVSDPRDALDYLLKENNKYKPNEHVKALYAQMVRDRGSDDFFVNYHLIIWGELNDRGENELAALIEQYKGLPVRIHLHDIKELVDEFVVGSGKAREKDIVVELRHEPGEVLKGNNYRLILANAGDVYRAFANYGWRLFDLNLRYEVRNSSVNGKIVETLKTAKGQRNFHHYNNGLIVVCSHYSIHNDEKIRIHNTQIINGLQTVKSIYNAVKNKEVLIDDLDKQCRVQMKVIMLNDPEFVAAIVQATNNQNPMKPRNLLSNAREQRMLRTALSNLHPRWFLQVKQEEWNSLSQEGGRFFKDVVHYPPSDFKTSGTPGRPGKRVVDNEDLAKAWLAFTGYSDFAGDRTTHFFSDTDVYGKAFRECPNEGRWHRFSGAMDFRPDRSSDIVQAQGGPHQYLLAYLLLELVKAFVPSPQKYRELGLNEGHAERKIAKASGEFTSSATEQDRYLADNATYQTWRVMANMKEVLVEAFAFVLSKKYGALEDGVCKSLMEHFDANGFLTDADADGIAKRAFETKDDLKKSELFSRTLQLLRYVAKQFWEEKRKTLSAASRLRTLLLSANMAKDFKEKIEETNARKGLSTGWKPEGQNFIESLPSLPT
jgi:hypothetical protein